jgi:hypothetical protein
MFNVQIIILQIIPNDFYIRFFPCEIYRKTNMTTEIVIFQQPDIKTTISTKSEIDIMYETFEANENLDKHHFQSFKEMDMMPDTTPTDSNIPLILLKQILPYCIPIIDTIPLFSVKPAVVDVFNKKKKFDASKAEKNKMTSYSIPMQLEYVIKCKVINHDNIKSHTVPIYGTFNVVGVEIPKKIIKTYNKAIPNMADSISIMNRLINGKYGLIDFQNSNYTQSYTEIIPSDHSNIVYFVSDEDARKKIKLITNYIAYVNNFYANNFALVYTHLQQKDVQTRLEWERNRYNITNYVEPEKQTISPLDKKFEKIMDVKLQSTFSKYFTLDKYNLFTEYNQINMLGVNHKLSQMALHKLTEIEDSNSYKSIKVKKNLEFVKKKALALNKFGTVDLTIAQKKIIDLEYDKLEKRKHTQLPIFENVNKLQWALSMERTKVIKENLAIIEKELKIPADAKTAVEADKQKVITNSSGVSIICPHVISRAHKMVEGVDTNGKKSSKQRYQQAGEIRDYLINVYSVPDVESGHYCKICGEFLAGSDDDEILKYISGKRVSFVSEVDTLKMQIWKDVSHIMTGYVKFKNKVQLKPIITSITNSVRDELGVVESDLLKVKTNNKDSIKDLMGIHTVVYVFAIVVHMINNNYGKITFSTRIGSAKSGGELIRGHHRSRKHHIDHNPSPIIDTPGRKPRKIGGKAAPKSTKNAQVILKNIINNALHLILHIKNIAINNVSSISSDSIKPLLLKAFKWAQTLNSMTESEKYKAPKQPLVNFLDTSNVYNYAEFVYEMTKHNTLPKTSPRSPKTSPRSPKTSPRSPKTSPRSGGSPYITTNKPGNPNTNQHLRVAKYEHVHEILGRDLQTIEDEFKADKGIYDTVPQFEQWDTKNKYKYDNYKLIIDYIQNKLYNKNAVPYSAQFIEYDTKMKAVKADEHLAYIEFKKKTRFPYVLMDLLHVYAISLNNFDPDHIRIEQHYCADGRKHKFNIYIYQKTNSKGAFIGSKKIITKSEIIDWVEKGNIKKATEFLDWFIVDEKCSVCNVLLSKVKNTNIEKALSDKYIIDSFFEYYEHRCPKGGLHDFNIDAFQKKESTCSKCKITKTIIDTKDSKFYILHKKQYEKLQAEQHSVEKLEMDYILKRKNKTYDSLKKFPSWTINNASILELSRLLKIKYNILINLGLTTNIKFQLIENEKINPHVNCKDDCGTARNVRLYDYYLYIQRFYYMIKNYEFISDISIELKTLMAKNKSANLYKKIPIVNADFHDKYMYYKQSSKSEVVSNFILHTICNTLLIMNKNLKNADISNATAIITHLANTIVKTEKLVSEPEASKFVFHKYDNDVGAESGNSDIDDIGDGDDIMDGYASQAESEKSIYDAVDSDPDDEFALGDIDIDADNIDDLAGGADF